MYGYMAWLVHWPGCSGRCIGNGRGGRSTSQKTARKVFYNVNENRSNDRKLSSFVRVVRLSCRIAILERTFWPISGIPLKLLPISDSEVTCGPMTRPAKLNSSATSSSNSTDFSSSRSTCSYVQLPPPAST